MKTAKFIKKLVTFTGDARLFELSEAVSTEAYPESDATTRFVVVSAVSAPFSGPETYIFPANRDGKVLSWGEMTGSFRGGLDHVEALRGAGFEVVGSPINERRIAGIDLGEDEDP